MRSIGGSHSSSLVVLSFENCMDVVVNGSSVRNTECKILDAVSHNKKRNNLLLFSAYVGIFPPPRVVMNPTPDS